MADTNNLSNFLEDVADAIRTKKETTEKIPAANFDTEILGITTGSDTSDATATADDIISPKTAYADGQKITGNIQVVNEDESIFLLPYTYVDSRDNRTVTINNIPEGIKHFILQDWDYDNWYIMLACIDENFAYWKYNGSQWLAYNNDDEQISDNNFFAVYKSFSQSADCNWVYQGSGYNNDQNWYNVFGGSSDICYNSDGSVFYLYSKKSISALIRNNTVYYEPYDATVTSNDLLEDKIAYNNTGKIQGTMPNNGELNYEVSTSEQTIPEGYTSGGTIAASPLTDGEYNECLNLSFRILTNTEYNLLNYIESTGTQYIDTGIIPNNNTVVKISIKKSGDIIDYERLCGVVNDFELLRNNTLNFIFRAGNKNIYDDIDISNEKFKVIQFGKGNIFINNNIVDSYSNRFSTDKNLYLFYSNGSDRYGSFKLQYCKIYENDELIRNFMPVLNDNIPCLYDTVTDEYFYNQGTGEFLYQ